MRRADKTALERTEEIAMMISDLGGLEFPEFKRKTISILHEFNARLFAFY